MSGKRRIFILTKRQIKTGDNALPLTAFALAFSPVCPLSENDGKTTPSLRRKLVRAFSPRKPRFRRRVRSSQGVAVAAHVRRRDSIFHFDEETTSSLRVARSNVFSSCYSFVLKVRFRGAKTNYYKIIRLTLHRMGYFFTRTRCEYHLSKTNITAILLTCKREYHCAARRPKEEPEEKTFEQA